MPSTCKMKESFIFIWIYPMSLYGKHFSYWQWTHNLFIRLWTWCQRYKVKCLLRCFDGRVWTLCQRYKVKGYERGVKDTKSKGMNAVSKIQSQRVCTGCQRYKVKGYERGVKDTKSRRLRIKCYSYQRYVSRE